MNQAHLKLCQDYQAKPHDVIISNNLKNIIGWLIEQGYTEIAALEKLAEVSGWFKPTETKKVG